jgi:GMP synthase (glutamine-hydrolysing)
LKAKDVIIILDCGSQYTQLIARRIRELRVYSEILPWDASVEEIRSKSPKGIVISGSSRNVPLSEAPTVSSEILEIGIPILGICYGMQLLCHILGGKIAKTGSAEYRRIQVEIEDENAKLFKGLPKRFCAWMSRGYSVAQLPPNVRSLAKSEDGSIAAMATLDDRIWGLQFHPEVAHTEHGLEILRNFLFDICSCEPSWNLEDWVEEKIKEVAQIVGNDKVICALSGGVDSTVAAVLTRKAIGDKLHCVFVDNGLLRLNEAENVLSVYRQKLNLDVRYVDASNEFLQALKGITDPEEKRKAVGKTFIDVFEREAEKVGDAKWLLQGTLYPDVIESGQESRGASIIKTHHNVGGLPEEMKLQLLEPLKDLFKDEVRAIGAILGIPHSILRRHPFPGPGLSVRCLGEVTPEKLELLRQADAIFMDELDSSGFYDKVWQAFCVLLPVRSVGVIEDERTYGYTIALRAVESSDGMTADWVYLSRELLDKIAHRICNEVTDISRVVLDVTSKPPATIEWE